jgi:hypothetical protein
MVGSEKSNTPELPWPVTVTSPRHRTVTIDHGILGLNPHPYCESVVDFVFETATGNWF